MKLKDKRLFRQKCYIDGKWVDAAGNKATFDVNNPADNSKLGTMPRLGLKETRGAIQSIRTTVSR